MSGKIIAIVGPTAVGKTRLSIEIAEKFAGEIVSCDSMQVYRGMNIGTAKVRLEETRGIPHHMLDIVNPDENFSAADFVKRAKVCINEIHNRVRLPVLVGGTGQYVDSVLSDIEFLEQPTDLVYRKFLFDVAVKNGAEFLHKKLAEVDAESAAKIHPNNVKRVARALEIFHATGMTVFEINAISRSRSKPYDALIFGLNIDRNILYARINARVDKMIMDGLASEVIALKNAGIPRDGTAMQAIGYKEIFDYFDIYNNQAQNFQNSAEFAIVIEKIKQRSRNYAKRQLTWFRRNPNIIWFDCALGFEKNLGKVFAKIREFGIM